MFKKPSSTVGRVQSEESGQPSVPARRAGLAQSGLTVDELVLLAGDVGDIDVVGRGGKLLVLLVGEDL